MDIKKIIKALGNDSRLQILEWLKDPEAHFAAALRAPACVEKKIDVKKVGICVGLIQQKAGLSQSTVSEYLSLLETAGLVQSQRIGQWTYYRRNQHGFTELLNYLKKL